MWRPRFNPGMEDSPREGEVPLPVAALELHGLWSMELQRQRQLKPFLSDENIDIESTFINKEGMVMYLVFLPEVPWTEKTWQDRVCAEPQRVRAQHKQLACSMHTGFRYTHYILPSGV